MILDADILIELLREQVQAETWLSSLPAMPFVSGMAALEVLFGAQDAVEQRKVQAYLSRFTVLWPSEADAQVASTLAPRRLSHGIDLIDAMTSATAIRHNLLLVTFNVKHFRSVPSLLVGQPYTRN